MSDVNPLIAIPGGVLFAIVGLWVAVAPEQFPSTGRTRVLDRLFGETVGTAILRLSGLLVAILFARYAVLGVAVLISTDPGWGILTA